DARMYKRGRCLLPLGFGSTHLDELTSTRHERLQLAVSLVGKRPYGRLNRFAEVSDDIRVNSICLCEPTGSLGELPDLSRVDNDDRQLGRNELLNEERLVPARRLEHDAVRSKLLQPLSKLDPTIRVVGD